MSGQWQTEGDRHHHSARPRGTDRDPDQGPAHTPAEPGPARQEQLRDEQGKWVAAQRVERS